MRKLMLLAAMLAMVLVAAAPAFAQATAIQVDNGDDDFGISDDNSVFDDNFDVFDDFGSFDNSDIFDDFDNNSDVFDDNSDFGDDGFDFSSGTNEADLSGISQVNTGDANAATVDGDADASIEQELNLGVTQSNSGFDSTGLDVFDNDLDNDGILDNVDLVILFVG